MGDDDAVIDAAQPIRSYLDRLTYSAAAELVRHLADAGKRTSPHYRDARRRCTACRRHRLEAPGFRSVALILFRSSPIASSGAASAGGVKAGFMSSEPRHR